MLVKRDRWSTARHRWQCASFEPPCIVHSGALRWLSLPDFGKYNRVRRATAMPRASPWPGQRNVEQHTRGPDEEALHADPTVRIIETVGADDRRCLVSAWTPPLGGSPLGDELFFWLG